MSASGHSQVNLFFRLFAMLGFWASSRYSIEASGWALSRAASGLSACQPAPCPPELAAQARQESSGCSASSDPPWSLPYFLPASAVVVPCTTLSCGNSVYLRINKENYDPERHAWHVFCHCSNDGGAELDSETCDCHYFRIRCYSISHFAALLLVSAFNSFILARVFS